MGDVDIKWEEINKIIHNVKYTLGIVSKAEKLLKTARQELNDEMEELHRIILKQPDRQVNSVDYNNYLDKNTDK